MRKSTICLTRLFALASLVLAATPALATTVPTVPEPGIMALLGFAGVVAAIVAIRRRRK